MPSSEDFLLSEASETPSSDDFSLSEASETSSSNDFYFPRPRKHYRPMILISKELE